ncbi:nervy [Carabus blaptoides fortunei]
MEPKIIKEESLEKEVSSYVDTQAALRTRSKTANPKDRCKTPDSPEGARLTQAPPSSPTQSSPIRHSSTNGNVSPLHNGGGSSADSLTPPPPLPTSLALSVSLDPNHVPPYTHTTNNNSSSSSSAASYGGTGLPVASLSRPLTKVKRFLSTLVQFGLDIAPDIGDRVRSLVLSLVSANVSVEEFHHSLQDVTNFPLRPFVLPFLRAHLPLLQREVVALARATKQTPLQYLRAHDHVVLEPAHSPAEPSEIFLSTSAETPPASAVKRRASDAVYENGLNGQHHVQEAPEYTPAKRPFPSQNFLLAHQSLLLPNLTHVPNPHFFDYAQHNHTTYPSQHRAEDPVDSTRSTRGDEEWRNIHVMLNCILSMVEKTKRALSILQQRNSQDLTNEWLRKQDVSVDLKKAANEIMAQAVRQTEDRVAEVKRKAEEAVNDVKRQAVVELQKAVTAAEIKANELVASERAKMEKLLLEARKHSEDANANHVMDAGGETSQSPPVSTAAQPVPSQQNSCWNCGRKAHETCSGCSIARYCGPFCQHKDWENHHQVCCSRDTKNRPQRTTTPGAAAPVPTPSLAAAAAVVQASQDTARLKK